MADAQMQEIMNKAFIEQVRQCFLGERVRQMTTPKDGGPAFPCLDSTESGLHLREPGMSLRDYLAAKAMQGMLADMPKLLHGFNWQENVARASYEIADAMLAEREKRK